MNRWQQYIKWILTCLIFFALPLLMIITGLVNYFNGSEELAYEKHFGLLKKVILTLRQGENTSDYLSSLVKRLINSAEKSQNPYAILEKGISSLNERFPKTFHFYVTDNTGKIIKSLSEPNSSNFVLNLFFQIMKENLPIAGGLRKYEELKKPWSIIQSFIGPDIDIEKLFGNHRIFLEVNSTKHKRRFFYGITRKFGLFVHADESANWLHLGITDLIKRFQHYGKVSDVEVGMKLPETPLPHSPIGKAISIFYQTARENQITNEDLITLAALETTGILWAKSPKLKVCNNHFLRISLVLITIILFSILCWFSFTIMLGYESMYFSIRWRLITLFSFASSLPLLVIFISSWDYLSQKYKTQEQQTFDQIERSMRAIDQQFLFVRGTIEAKMNRMFDGQAFGTEEEKLVVKRKLKIIAKTAQQTQICMYDKNGDEIFSIPEPTKEELNKKGRKTLGKAVANIISSINNEPVTNNDIGSMLLESFGGVTDPISLMRRTLGRIADVNFGTEASLTYMKALYSHDNKATHIIVVNWKKEDAEINYLESRIKREEKKLSGVRLFATTRDMLWGSSGSFKFLRKVPSITTGLLLGQNISTDHLYSQGKNFMVMGLSTKELKRVYLYAAFSDQKINENIYRQKCQLGGFALITAIISIFLGIILSQKFLHPIEDLSQGVLAVQNKNFRHRVPKGENDELGELAEMFNKMIENLHEVSMASEVQKRLFPSGVLTSGEYKVNGKSIPASQLGGDYFDYVAIQNRFLLVFIGDVTGHGVPAAIVMAMCKAVMIECSNTGADAQKILETLNRTIFQSMKRKLLMTAGAIWIDTITHQTSFFNCGHPFPYKRDVNGELSMLKSMGDTLGFREKLKLQPNHFTLQPGERILLYSDGLVESIDNDDGKSHYDHFSKYLHSRPLLPLESACDDILENHSYIKTGLPRPDDFTILIVERTTGLPSQENPLPLSSS
ncbi:MAG: SpoIIE family protein phosphatase [Candidatus Riflebacteria bacterium]|nr:SpoIIE family protein phosphatase [Candidatus Riflebacteria bacterium]